VVGHEGAGTVTEAGPEVTLVRPGDRVVAVFTAACGTCWQCTRGRSHLCERSAELRAASAGRLGGADVPAMGGLGTMAEYMTLHESQAIAVQTSLPDEQLALIGCGVTTGAGASLFAAGVQPGSTVAVVGCGGVGMSAIQGARVAGAAVIIAVDPVAAKRSAAIAFGATTSIDPTAPDALEQLRALTDGRGAEFALEVAGRLDAMRFAYDATCRGGRTVFVGALDRRLELSLPANELHANCKTIVGTSYGNSQVRRDVPRLAALAESGKLDLKLMISKRFPLDEVNAAMSAMEQGDVIRSVLTF
jgi:S-(hydroxymethyl)glutathione dehydrogenase/alcohol dehydrogenase